MTKVIILKSGEALISPNINFEEEEMNDIVSFLKEGNIITLIGNYDLYSKIENSCQNYSEIINLLYIPDPLIKEVPYTIKHFYDLGINCLSAKSIISCINHVYPWIEKPMFSYYELLNDSHPTKNRDHYTSLSSLFNEIGIPAKNFNETNIEQWKKNWLKDLRGSNYQGIENISLYANTKKQPHIKNLLFSDKMGTIIGNSFFEVEAPFEQNIQQVIEYLKTKENHLCTIVSGQHQNGFISDEIFEQIECFNTLENLICFDQYSVATTLKDGYRKQANDIWLGFGQSSKATIAINYLKYLKQIENFPDNMYAVGDNPLEDLPMLKEIYLRNGEVAFICPYHKKEDIVNALKNKFLNTSVEMIKLQYTDEELKSEYGKRQIKMAENKILDKYYTAVQNICENWDWLESSIYPDAHQFIKKINRK